MTDWTAKRILRDLAGAEERKAILSSFWKHADEHARHAALLHLAKALRFREQSLRAMPVGKKAELLGSRIGAPEMADTLDAALMAYHTEEARPMMAAFLDRWSVPHREGLIEAEEYEVPREEAVEQAVVALADSYPLRAILIYLATAGLLMGDEWREAAWPVVERHLGELQG